MPRTLFSILFLLLAALNAHADCASDTTSCAYYCKKAESLGCDTENYLNKFGYHYCSVFWDKNAEFSDAAQGVLENIRNCLIKTLEDTPNLSCENVKGIAYASHVACYVNNNFCTMALEDKIKIFLIMKRQWPSPDFLEVMDKVVKACGPDVIDPRLYIN